MATSTALLSIDEYLRTSFHPDADFVDGEIEERNLGEYEHARLQSLISALFVASEAAWGLESVVEQRIRVSPNRVRICDIAILHGDAPHEPVTTTPPLLCIEILSPEDRISRAELVLADYLAMGVANIWLIDPLRRCAYTYDNTGLRIADPTNLTILHTPRDMPIAIDLTPAFAQLDKRRPSARS
jgi:Uma2 family endonuclease